MRGPLNGIRVLTVESFIAGPMASMWLADAGAEVVKIEAPARGDTARNVPPMKGTGERLPEPVIHPGEQEQAQRRA